MEMHRIWLDDVLYAIPDANAFDMDVLGLDLTKAEELLVIPRGGGIYFRYNGEDATTTDIDVAQDAKLFLYGRHNIQNLSIIGDASVTIRVVVLGWG